MVGTKSVVNPWNNKAVCVAGAILVLPTNCEIYRLCFICQWPLGSSDWRPCNIKYFSWLNCVNAEYSFKYDKRKSFSEGEWLYFRVWSRCLFSAYPRSALSMGGHLDSSSSAVILVNFYIVALSEHCLSWTHTGSHNYHLWWMWLSGISL